MTAIDRVPPILMFARERFCPDVARTRERLTDLGIAWTERDVEADDEAATEMRRLTGRVNGSAIAFWSNRRTGSWTTRWPMPDMRSQRRPPNPARDGCIGGIR